MSKEDTTARIGEMIKSAETEKSRYRLTGFGIMGASALPLLVLVFPSVYLSGIPETWARVAVSGGVPLLALVIWSLGRSVLSLSLAYSLRIGQLEEVLLYLNEVTTELNPKEFADVLAQTRRSTLDSVITDGVLSRAVEKALAARAAA